MKTFWLSICLLLSLGVGNAQSMRERLLMNEDWRFAKGHAADKIKDFNYGRALSFSKVAFIQESTLLNADQESRMSIPHTAKFDDSNWEKISLPHDWGMALGYSKEQFKVKGYRKLGGRSPENSVGWYRKTFTEKLTKGCRYKLEFEGIFRDAQVWMNGIYLGKGESGYVPLVFDVTECLNYEPDSKNVIAVRVDATHSELWSYEGAGIYRNVWLTRMAPVHVAQWGTYVQTDVNLNDKTAQVKAQVEVENSTSQAVEVEIRNTIVDKNGMKKAEAKTIVSVDALAIKTGLSSMNLQNVDLWSLKSPSLYKLYTEIVSNGKVVDSYTTSFGIRDMKFDPDKGFFLNGERVQIQGVCCHQDHAGVGIAVPDQLNAWRIKKLKEYGVNAYRASHNPPTESVLNACDSLGVLVMDEMRVLSASDEGLNQMGTVIRRDRNHPSVFIWCLGNEEPAIQGSEKGIMIIERMKAIQRKLDPSRPCTAAMNGSWGQGFTRAVDVQGFNYYTIGTWTKGGSVDDIHKKFPNLPCILTEEASTLTTRGIYKTEAEKGFHQSYDRDHPDWGATAQRWMKFVDERKFLAGAFVWTGFDYGGESVAHYWPGVVSHFGILDYCGFPKDAFWYYKAWWTDEPVLHVLPHWNGLGTDSVDVHVYTNMEQVELIVNGKSQGKQQVAKYDIPAWRVKYVPGSVKVKGWKNGKKYIQTVETTGEPVALQLLDESMHKVKVDTRDVAVVTVKVLDKKGRLIPTAENKIQFNVTNGRILGVGNGHPSSHEADVFEDKQNAYRNAFGGYAQLLVASDGSGKPILIKATSDGLKASELHIEVE